MSLPNRPVLAGLLEGDAQVLHRQGILVTNVDVALVRADCIRADDHSLDHGVGIALHQRAVHERARVSFVAVGDHVFDVALRVSCVFPFAAGGKAGAAATAQPRLLDFFDHLFGGHRSEYLAQGLITAHRDVLLNRGRINAAGVAQHDAHLPGVERDLVVILYGLAARRLFVE